MANSKSAVKRMRQAIVRRQRNRIVKSHIKKALLTFSNSLESNDQQKAREAYCAASSVIDKAVSKGVIHKNTGSRKKSRLSQKLKQLVS
ncbi:MAG: 30S ribosomal protein S20 [Bacillota bacterium]|nr:30S ribosomal protein S20 [Bacillota bacterium]